MSSVTHRNPNPALLGSSSRPCPSVAPLAQRSGQINISRPPPENCWPTEPDKASVFPAVAAAAVWRQLHQQGGAELPHPHPGRLEIAGLGGCRRVVLVEVLLPVAL